MPWVLTMRFMERASLDSLVNSPHAVRDRVATALIDFVPRELFVFGAMTPLRQDSLSDFGRSDPLKRLRDMRLAIGNDRELAHVLPAQRCFCTERLVTHI